MSGGQGDSGGIRRYLRLVVRGREDTRVRATWRALLAVVLLWVVTGPVLTGNVLAAVAPVLSRAGVGTGLVQSLVHAALVVALLVPWARYLDRRQLSAYGVAATPRWAGELLAGTVALLVGFGLWYGLGTALGWTTVTVALSASPGALVAGFVLGGLALLLHAAAQEVVFFRVVLQTAVEGWHSRGLGPRHAAVAGVAATLPAFLAIHELTPLRALDLAVAGTVFGLLYVHTGELSLGIGVHFGALFSGSVFSTAGDPKAVFAVDQTLPAALSPLAWGYPKVLVAYALLVGYLYWRDGDVGVALDLDGERS
jgi:hypothetical protein